MKIGGQRPDYYSDGQPQNRSGGLPHRAAAYDTGDAPCDSSAGVNFPDQDIRSFTCHNISQYTAPYTGKDADKNKEKSKNINKKIYILALFSYISIVF